jgi:hypothetical protein
MLTDKYEKKADLVASHLLLVANIVCGDAYTFPSRICLISLLYYKNKITLGSKRHLILKAANGKTTLLVRQYSYIFICKCYRVFAVM